MNGLSLQLMKSLGAKLLGQQLPPLDSAAHCSYITPNILAIGRMTEDNAEHALRHLHGCRHLVWNLTGSPVAPGIQQKLMRQIVNIPWEKFAYNIPTIVDMLNLCYALSSWLSFDIQNVAVFYYGDLPPVRPGILFACYQKYVNGDLICAFDAFAQYCHDHNIELAGDAIPCSLRKFFDNFDQVVSNGGFPNTVPYLLRRIVIQGLPVDEMPLLEVRECSSTSTETYLPEDQAGAASWTGEDGSFAFNQYICGEFAIICYFGGEHYWRPNNSTLIFKLHDNTGLLPAEPLRIQKNQVDIPLKDHRDIIDEELFAVDIFFEQPFDIDAAGPKRLPKDVLCGYEAFVGGIACLSSWHTEEISFARLEQLAEEGFDTNIANLSLQIANNNLEVAMGVATRLREHLLELRKQGLVKRRGSDVIQVGAVLDRAATDLVLPSPPSSSAVSPRMSPGMRRTQSFASRSNSSSGGNSTSKSSMGRKRALTDATCAICNSGDILKRAQLISCTQCRRHYHTYCAGEPAIPFKLSTATEKQHHSNYVKQRFGNWRCTVCVTGADSIVADHCSAATVVGPGEGTRSRTASTSSTSSSPILDPNQHGDGSSDMVPSRSVRRLRDASPRAVPAVNDQKSSAGSSQASPASGGSGKGRNNAAAAGANGQGSPAGAGDAGKDDHADLLEAVLSPRFDRQRASSHAGTPNTRPLASAFNRQHGAFADSPDMELARQIIPHLKQLQRIGSVEELLQRPEALAQLFQVVGATQPGSPASPGKTSRPSSGESKPASAEGVPLGEHPLYGKYFKMVKVGLPVDTAKHKLRMEHPDADPSLLDQSPSTRVSLNAGGSGLGGSGSGTGSGEGQGASDKIALKDHPVYGKYFKMLKVGLPKGAVQQKLLAEFPDADATMLNRDPESLAPVPTSSAAAASTNSSDQQVALKDHPTYGKFFKMMKVGMPMELVKQKLQAEFPNADCSMLEESPDKLVVVIIGDQKSQTKKIALKDQPVYGKFFKMLKVGIPKEVVKKKLAAEHPTADLTMMDQDPDFVVEEQPQTMVAAQDHPLYQKYFKMLKVGLPMAAVKAKMALEGVDQSVLDKLPETMIPVEAAAEQAAAKAKAEPPAPKVRRRKLHWKPIPADRLNDTDSIWAGVNENTRAVHIDLDEFEKLFVARETPGSAEEKPKKAAAQKVQRVTLIEGKRAQNCAIALARIKMAYSDMAERIRLMEDRYFTGDQLTSVLEFVPTQEDIQALKGYTGDRALLGEAEKFMLEMMNVPKAKDLIAGMAYMQQFSTRVLELKKQVAIIDNACDDVKLSMKLRKVLAIVLKLGNFMNQEQQLSGFTLDSLLKLRTVKGFDQKTSMLHYLVRLVKVNDEAALDFKSDLTHVPAASRVVLDSLVAEKAALRQGFEQVEQTAREALGLRFVAEAAPKRDLMQEFEQEQEQNQNEDDSKEQKEQPAKISKQERIEQIRHRRTQTRISKSAHGHQLVHFDAALEVTPPSGSTPANAVPRSESAESQPSEQHQSEQQEEEKQEGGVAEDSVPKTPQAATALDTAASSRHQRRSSARSDRTAPLPEHNVLDFIHNASERLDELDRAIDALVQKFQSVLAFFGEDPKMQSHEFFNTLSAFVAAFVEAHDQVQRIEKSKARQKKQEEALEQRKLLRRASQPAMKISSKLQQEKPKESVTDELVGGAAAQESAVVEQPATVDSSTNSTAATAEISTEKAGPEKTCDAVTDDQQPTSEDAMSMRPSQAESTSDSESVHSVQSLTLDGETGTKQPPKPANLEACEHAA